MKSPGMSPWKIGRILHVRWWILSVICHHFCQKQVQGVTQKIFLYLLCTLLYLYCILIKLHIQNFETSFWYTFACRLGTLKALTFCQFFREPRFFKLKVWELHFFATAPKWVKLELSFVGIPYTRSSHDVGWACISMVYHVSREKMWAVRKRRNNRTHLQMLLVTRPHATKNV